MAPPKRHNYIKGDRVWVRAGYYGPSIGAIVLRVTASTIWVRFYVTDRRVKAIDPTERQETYTCDFTNHMGRTEKYGWMRAFGAMGKSADTSWNRQRHTVHPYRGDDVRLKTSN